MPFIDYKTRRAQALLDEKRNKCSITIQSFVRGCKGRRVGESMAQQVYFKYIDDSGLHYWYNSRTATSVWYKPKLLHTSDCGFPVILPPEELLMIIYCTVCEIRTMQCICDECNELMCDVCFHKTHKTGQRKSHEYIKIPNCNRCEFQVGTKHCVFCNVVYCDTCFDYNHRKASFRTHHYKWLTDSCTICQKRSAQWCACRADTNWFETFVCTTCCKSTYGDPHVSLLHTHVYCYSLCLFYV
jgi:hypothetical protein